MKWTIYLVLNLIKLIIISGLVLLSLFVLPIIVLLLSLGILLSYIRDNEGKIYNYNLPTFVPSKLASFYIKSFEFLVSPQLISRLQHIHIIKNKSLY